MKRVYLFICFCTVLATIRAQELFEINIESTDKSMNNFFYETPYKKAYTGKVNRSLLDSMKLVVTLPEEGKIEYVVFTNTEKKWVGISKDNTSNLIIIKSENSITGFLTTLESNYQIFSLDNEEILLVEATSETFEGNICGIEELYMDQQIPEFFTNSRVAITDEPLKILFAYTERARQLVENRGSNITDYSLLLIEITNMSYRNSFIGHRLELAACVNVDYSGSGSIQIDLNRLRNTTDGYLDEIHSLRDVYSADVCALLIGFESEGGNGIAALNATAVSAFCVVKASLAATEEFIFAHEIGHLQGARHDLGEDPSIYPRKDAHGYISPNNNWRTIMAYATFCDGCNAIQYWSNPFRTYPGDGLAMGSEEYENNALVLNQNTEKMKSFRTPPITLSLSQSGLENVRYGEIEATSKISTSGTVIVESSCELILKAPTVELNGGFSMDLGAEIIIGP